MRELEEKFRNCEQQGIEASGEMQIAARRVLDENQRLRTFLKSKGINEEELNTIVGVATSELPDDNSMNQQAAVESLQSIIASKRPCCPSGESCGSPSAASVASIKTSPSVTVALPSIPNTPTVVPAWTQAINPSIENISGKRSIPGTTMSAAAAAASLDTMNSNTASDPKTAVYDNHHYVHQPSIGMSDQNNENLNPWLSNIQTRPYQPISQSGMQTSPVNSSWPASPFDTQFFQRHPSPFDFANVDPDSSDLLPLDLQEQFMAALDNDGQPTQDNNDMNLYDFGDFGASRIYQGGSAANLHSWKTE